MGSCPSMAGLPLGFEDEEDPFLEELEAEEEGFRTGVRSSGPESESELESASFRFFLSLGILQIKLSFYQPLSFDAQSFFPRIFLSFFFFRLP